MRDEIRHKDMGVFIDSLVVNRNKELADQWLKFAHDPDNEYKLVDFVRTYRPGFALPKKIYNPIRGSYNINWRLEFEDGLSVMIHVPIPHCVAFPDEKIRAEAAAMMLIRNNTTIPVPEVYGWCTTTDNPTGYGPLIVMEYIEHTQCLEHIIRDEIKAVGSGNPKKGSCDETLLKAYRQMANIMLQLSTIEGSAIGFPSVPKSKAHKPPLSSSSAKAPVSSHSMQQPPSRTSRVHRRSLSQSTSDLVIMGGIPPSILPPTDKTYKTSHEYYQAMADMHLAHLAFQHNSVVTSPPDGREKYVARQLFRRLAREGRLTEDKEGGNDSNTWPLGQQKEGFKLWCDDMRPTSVLLNDNNDVVGVIDWEMSYFAPASFHNSPPWWLIIDRPEFYKKGISAWVKEYERHLPLFLKAMEMEEVELRKTQEKTIEGCGGLSSRLQLLAIDEAVEYGRTSTLMSKRMKHNWEDGRFFVDYCARRNYGFDPFYWRYVDKKFFGEQKKTGLLRRKRGYKGRLHLLSEMERAQMEPFIAWKLEDRDSDDEKVVEWDGKDAQAIMEACLAGTLGKKDIPKPRVIPWTMTDRPDSP